MNQRSAPNLFGSPQAGDRSQVPSLLPVLEWYAAARPSTCCHGNVTLVCALQGCERGGAVAAGGWSGQPHRRTGGVCVKAVLPFHCPTVFTRACPQEHGVGGQELLSLDGPRLAAMGVDASDPASAGYKLLVRAGELRAGPRDVQGNSKASAKPRMLPRRQSEKILEIIHLLEHSTMATGQDGIYPNPVAQYVGACSAHPLSPLGIDKNIHFILLVF